MITSVIFDIDGTLVDSVDLHARAWQEAFQHFGYDFAFDDIRQQIGKGGDKLIPHFLQEDADRLGEKIEKYRGELWKKEYLPQVKPFPKVRELFERILEDGKKIALASSSKEDELKAYKRIAGIEDLVNRETSADDVENSKPDPDVIHVALAKLHNPDPAEVIMVGDTPYDVEAAKKANVLTIGVLSGGFPEVELRAAGCVAIYHDVAELLDHYQESLLAPKATRAA